MDDMQLKKELEFWKTAYKDLHNNVEIAKRKLDAMANHVGEYDYNEIQSIKKLLTEHEVIW